MNLRGRALRRIEDPAGTGELSDACARSPSANAADADLLDAYSRAVIVVVR